MFQPVSAFTQAWNAGALRASRVALVATTRMRSTACACTARRKRLSARSVAAMASGEISPDSKTLRAQPRHLAVFMQGLEPVRDHPRNLQPAGVRSDINSGKSGHAQPVSPERKMILGSRYTTGVTAPMNPAIQDFSSSAGNFLCVHGITGNVARRCK